MMAPKGVVDKNTWQRISRSVDYVDQLYESLSKELNLKDDTASRITPIGKEVLEWRAILRRSEFLEHKEVDKVFNIHGDEINPELRDISKMLGKKRKWYVKQSSQGVNLENISMSHISVTNDDDSDDDSDGDEE